MERADGGARITQSGRVYAILSVPKPFIRQYSRASNHVRERGHRDAISVAAHVVSEL
jgi:hypothetical protein